MALKICPVLVRRHLPRPAAVLPSGRRVDVLHRRGPRIVVLVVVLGAERLEYELRRLEPPRDVEIAWDEGVHATIVERWLGHVVLVVATNTEPGSQPLLVRRGTSLCARVRECANVAGASDALLGRPNCLREVAELLSQLRQLSRPGRGDRLVSMNGLGERPDQVFDRPSHRLVERSGEHECALANRLVGREFRERTRIPRSHEAQQSGRGVLAVVAHVQKRCRPRAKTVPAKLSACPACGGDVGWRARYRAPDGRERSRAFERRSDAGRWLVAIASTKLRGDWLDPAAGRMTFETFAAEWFAGARHLRPDVPQGAWRASQCRKLTVGRPASSGIFPDRSSLNPPGSDGPCRAGRRRAPLLQHRVPGQDRQGVV